MPIEVRSVENPSHKENITYDVHCTTCPDISKESGDEIDRPYEIVGFEEEATFDTALKAAADHDRRYHGHKIIVRGFDWGKMRGLFS